MGSSASVLKKPAPKNGADTYSKYEGKGPFYVMNKDSEATIRYAPSGPASKEACPPRTMVDIFAQAAKSSGDKVALMVERDAQGNTPADVDGRPAKAFPEEKWTKWTFKQYYADASAGARALMSLGVEQFGTVAIYGFNSPEWFLSEMSAMLCGAKAAGIYPSDSRENVIFKCQHSETSVLIVEANKMVKKLQPYKCKESGEEVNPLDSLPKLKHVIVWGEKPEAKSLNSKNGEVSVIHWKDFMAKAAETDEKALAERQSKMKPGHCACLIYTSGTTGRPKAVMISHDNLIYQCSSISGMLAQQGVATTPAQERALSYLPLSHVAGMMVDIINPLYTTATSKSYVTIYFARPYDLKRGTLKDRLVASHPTMFLGVPRVWEKIQDKMTAVGKSITGLKKSVSTWCKKKNLSHARSLNLSSSEVKNPMGLGLAQKVMKKAKMALGLQDCKIGVTGAAPIGPKTLEYFGQLDMNINELYGMSECGGVTTFSLDSTHEWGSCGFEVPGMEVKIFKCDPEDFTKKEECPLTKDIFNATDAEQGEICFRGRHIMMGYLANPDLVDGGTEQIKKKNEGAIDGEGWLHSGDMGCKSVDGMVKITGRYKEIIIGAGGENIAPVPIEKEIKVQCPAISNIMMVGDKQPYNVAIVALKTVGATGELPGGKDLDGPALELDEKVKTVDEAFKSEKVVKAIEAAIIRVNKNPKVVTKNAASIRKFTILPADFSVLTGELTATLKLKRSVVSKQYAKLIAALYDPKLPKSQTYVDASTVLSN